MWLARSIVMLLLLLLLLLHIMNLRGQPAIRFKLPTSRDVQPQHPRLLLDPNLKPKHSCIRHVNLFRTSTYKSETHGEHFHPGKGCLLDSPTSGSESHARDRQMPPWNGFMSGQPRPGLVWRW